MKQKHLLPGRKQQAQENPLFKVKFIVQSVAHLNRRRFDPTVKP